MMERSVKREQFSRLINRKIDSSVPKEIDEKCGIDPPKLSRYRSGQLYPSFGSSFTPAGARADEQPGIDIHTKPALLAYYSATPIGRSTALSSETTSSFLSPRHSPTSWAGGTFFKPNGRMRATWIGQRQPKCVTARRDGLMGGGESTGDLQDSPLIPRLRHAVAATPPSEVIMCDHEYNPRSFYCIKCGRSRASIIDHKTVYQSHDKPPLKKPEVVMNEPNALTRQVMEDTDNGIGLVGFDTFDDLLADLEDETE